VGIASKEIIAPPRPHDVDPPKDDRIEIEAPRRAVEHACVGRIGLGVLVLCGREPAVRGVVGQDGAHPGQREGRRGIDREDAGMGMRRPQQLHMQHTRHRDIEREAGRPGHDLRSVRRRQAAPARFPGVPPPRHAARRVSHR
jgi:hypothetical protein